MFALYTRKFLFIPLFEPTRKPWDIFLICSWGCYIRATPSPTDLYSNHRRIGVFPDGNFVPFVGLVRKVMFHFKNVTRKNKEKYRTPTCMVEGICRLHSSNT